MQALEEVNAFMALIRLRLAKTAKWA